MLVVLSPEGICPLRWKSAFKRTTERRQAQPQDGRSDTGADRLFGWLNGDIKPSINPPDIDVLDQKTPHIESRHL